MTGASLSTWISIQKPLTLYLNETDKISPILMVTYSNNKFVKSD